MPAVTALQVTLISAGLCTKPPRLEAIAQVCASRNDAKGTFEWLDRALSNRDSGISYLFYDPLILRYKDDPRFAAFCRKVGLAVPGQAAPHPT